MDENGESDDETFVHFGSLFSDEDDFLSEEAAANNEKSRHHQGRDSFSEMWLILRKSESDVLDVLYHARYMHYHSISNVLCTVF